MDYYTARNLAERITTQLGPHCEKIKICGSLRRKKSEIGDIDIVCIPKTVAQRDLFGMVSHHVRDPKFVEIVNSWPANKGDAAEGKYTQRVVDGHKVEISMATHDNFGNLVVIRTGNAEFSHELMKIALRRGYNQKDGYLYKGEQRIVVPDEHIYFNTLGIPYIEPHLRNGDALKHIKR
jgi:DNA polymerase/3'-5' exonuclease PolX